MTARLLLAILLVPLAAVAEPVHEERRQVMGTLAVVAAWAEDPAVGARAVDAAYDAFDRVDREEIRVTDVIVGFALPDIGDTIPKPAKTVADATSDNSGDDDDDDSSEEPEDADLGFLFQPTLVVVTGADRPE